MGFFKNLFNGKKSQPSSIFDFPDLASAPYEIQQMVANGTITTLSDYMYYRSPMTSREKMYEDLLIRGVVSMDDVPSDVRTQIVDDYEAKLENGEVSQWEIPSSIRHEVVEKYEEVREESEEEISYHTPHWSEPEVIEPEVIEPEYHQPTYVHAEEESVDDSDYHQPTYVHGDEEDVDSSEYYQPTYVHDDEN